MLLLLREPKPGEASPSEARRATWKEQGPDGNMHDDNRSVIATIRELLGNPMVLILTAVFVGANFVAMIFLTWMPSFLFQKFNMSLAMAGLSGTAYLQIASVLGVISGGVLADRLARRHRGGRMMAQAAGLLIGVPFIFITGWTLSVPVLIGALIGFGYFKGFYDANIASCRAALASETVLGWRWRRCWLWLVQAFNGRMRPIVRYNFRG